MSPENNEAKNYAPRIPESFRQSKELAKFYGLQGFSVKRVIGREQSG